MSQHVLPASPRHVARLLAGPGVSLRTGPFVYRLRSDAPALSEPLALHYGGWPLSDPGEFHDFDIQLMMPAGLRRWARPQVRFRFDGATPFEPLPQAHAFPMLEWAMNWCITSHVNAWLLIHAAVVERGGRAMILPAPPGSGKSTLCAALVHRGWRLLSDEIALIPFDGSGLRALARPVSLKNKSIDVIMEFAPEAILNTPVHGTQKGTVAHMRAPVDHLDRSSETAQPAWVVFPRWKQGASTQLTPRGQAETLVNLARNSFNAGTLGGLGFDTLAAVVSACECHDLEYSELDGAIAAFEALSSGLA